MSSGSTPYAQLLSRLRGDGQLIKTSLGNQVRAHPRKGREKEEKEGRKKGEKKESG